MCFTVLHLLPQAQRAALEREALKATAKSAGAAQMVCPWSGVIINVDEARQRDHKSGRNYQCALQAPDTVPLRGTAVLSHPS